MTWRAAAADDLPALRDFLLRRVESAMFSLSNLAEYQLNGDAPRAMRFLIDRDGDDIRNAFGITRAGMMMPHLPEMDANGYRMIAGWIGGWDLTGAIGEAGQVRALLAALGLEDVRCNADSDDPALILDMNQLVIPDSAGFDLKAPAPADDDLLLRWRTAYHMETLGTPGAAARDLAAMDVARARAKDSLRLLHHRGVAVAMTNYNSEIESAVQVGGVYTPPRLRNRGYARRVVALHMQELRREGIARAMLFAANEAAVKAYQAVGFRRWGEIAMVLFSEKEQVA